MYVGLAVYALCCFILLVQGVASGNTAQAVVMAWFTSPVIMLVMRIVFEKGKPKGLFHPSTQSWMFLFGDTIFLPFAFGAAAFGWRKLDTSGGQWYTTWWWMLVSAGVGVIAGMLFHRADITNYTRQGMELALSSPTKWAHDFVAYPVLFGGLLALGVPVIFSSLLKPYGILILVGIVLWGLMGVRDAGLILSPLKAVNLHPKWDRFWFHVIS